MKIQLFALVLITVIIVSCFNGSHDNSVVDSVLTDSAVMAVDSVDQVVEKAKQTLSNWEYSESEDKMTSKKTYFATVTSPTVLGFDFPYDGSVATLTIRKRRGITDVVLQVSKGQFHNEYGEEPTIGVRFDKNAVKSYSCSEAADNSSDVLFIDNVKSFLANLKQHKKLVVEASFYQEGTKQIEFDIQGLVWQH